MNFNTLQKFINSTTWQKLFQISIVGLIIIKCEKPGMDPVGMITLLTTYSKRAIISVRDLG